MDARTKRDSEDRPISAAALGALVAFLETNGLDRRRYRIVNRLRALSNSDDFASLPDDLRDRVREIVRDADR